jgi:predicted nucleic acid-binding protein
MGECMAMTPKTKPIEIVVLDASVAVAICAREADKVIQAQMAMDEYSQDGTQFYSPNVFVSEVLYVLCKQVNKAKLTVETHKQSITDFEKFLLLLEPNPNGDYPLMRRAEEIRGDYACRRSADGLYIALAEQLSATYETVLLTFDEDMPKQAARHAPNVTVRLLPVTP